MKQKTKKQQGKDMNQSFRKRRTVSALMAFGLAAVITVFGASNSFGVQTNEEITDIDSQIDMELLAEAVAEVEKKLYPLRTNATFDTYTENLKTILVFNADNKLVGEITLKEDEVVEDEELQVLINRSEYLSSYGNTSIYRISE
ncbi:hypothetical protein ACV07N_14955 [Roseivirga echinicomitans]